FSHGRSRAVFLRLDLWRWKYRERTGREPRVPIGGSDDRDVHGNRFCLRLRSGVEVGRREPVSVGRRARESPGRSAGHIPHVLRAGHRRPGWLHGLRLVSRRRSHGLRHPSRTRVRATRIVSGERHRHRRERRNGIGLRVGHHLEHSGDSFRDASIGKHGYLVRIQRDGDGWRRRPFLLFVGLRGRPVRRWARGLPPISEPRQLRALRSRDRFIGGGPHGGPLNVTFRMSTSLAAVNETVSFIATGGGGSGGYTCSWDFGDNTSATGCSSSHAWHATGSYRVLLSVSDSSGHHGSSAQSVDVIVALTASFSVGPTPAIVGETAQIIAHPTGGIGPYNCTWDFGDASGATGCAVSHVWTTRGQYTIQLSVNDS